MKKLKRMMALIIAVAMVMAMSMTVFATSATPQAEPGEFNKGDFSQTAETSVEATGLKAGDTVEVYQLVKWDTTASDWVLNGTCGVTLDELKNGITEAEATTIAGAVSTAALTTLTADADGKVTYSCEGNPGLFYLKAIPGTDNKDTAYNPAFVSADYYEGGNTVDFSSKIGSSAVFKSSSIPFDKEVTGADTFVDVKPGDKIPYKISTQIPSYGTTYTNPQFKITDTLSDGLVLDGDITVKYGDATTTQTVTNVLTITKGTPTNGFTVEFAKDYLTGLNGATPTVEITYQAEVTTAGGNNVTYMDNKAKLTFSNSPSTTKDQDDITRHYTFAIDGDLLGRTGEEGSELIKTGTDANGNILTENRKTYHSTQVSALNGASFKLVGTGALAGVEKTATSDANGRINFDGLDAGTYTLTEESAPAGFIKDSRTFTVTITPTYSTDPATPDLLVSYEITITAPASGSTAAYNGGATFNMTNEGGVTVQSTVESDSNFINNTQGAELPSTGGIGTTIFYIVGTILVIGAGVILVTRRRMDA